MIKPLPWRNSFVKARAALSHDDVSTAKPLLEEIASALPNDLEVQLYAAWARMRLAESISDGDFDLLDTLARRALGSGESLALPLCILGHTALRRGELAAARRLFRRAAAADPALIDARRGVQMVERRLSHKRSRREGLHVLALFHSTRLVLTIMFVLASIAALIAERAT